ncbi:MAG: type II toxin-antitoxin system RelE/ParE family toxin [Patescibacteria group bacterium]
MLTINTASPAESYFKRLPPKHRRQVSERILKLAENPKASDTRLLRGYEYYYRADIGEHRIIYRFTRAILFVDLIGKRNDDDIYRRMKRLRG